MPNFSEGRNSEIIRFIVNAMSEVKGIVLLDVDMGPDTNRTVVTIVGPPEAIVEAGFRGIAAASTRIDMQTQKGEHPRVGATDVFPIVPFQNVTIQECISITRQLGERVGNELGIPVFLYAESATHPKRKSLSLIRSGEYEKMDQKLKKSNWKSDFGPVKIHPQAGVTVIGARKLLIAFNINLATQDLNIAKTIAAEIRETGKMIKKEGKSQRIPGLLKACQAIGWFLSSYGMTQVSMNLTDFLMTPPHKAYETCKLLAMKYGTRAMGSELVGMIPQQALLMAGRFYALESSLNQLTDGDLITMATEAMGLNTIRPFDPKKKIIEERMKVLCN